MTDQPIERFRPTSGRFSGYLGLACAAVVLVLAALSWGSHQAVGVVIATLVAAVLVWAALLRPALWLTPDELVMRGIFHTDHLPLGAISRVAVGQVLAVNAHGKRYVSPVIGHSLRSSLRSRPGARTPAKTPSAADSYQVFVEERILHRATEHRELHGDDDLAVRRTIAWPELAAVGVGVLAFVVWLLV
jgi:hypothetical protein